MKPYKIEIKKLIFYVGLLSIIIFSAVLLGLGMVETHKMGEILLHYGFLIAPITLLWVGLETYLWRTQLFQSMQKWMHLPPDIRGRWEGELKSSLNQEPQKFVLEIRQTMTTLHVHSYTPISHSHGVLVNLAYDESKSQFILCFLWEGEIPTEIQGRELIQRFHGYTMLWLVDTRSSKSLNGSYFTDHRPVQSTGHIKLTLSSHTLQHQLG